MKKQLFFLTTLLLATTLAHAQTVKKVLFVGNSYTEVNDLPNMVSDIANSLGDRLVYESNTPGGCTFSQHCQNRSMELIRRGGWDAVVLQEQSQYPAFPDEQVQREVFPYAQQLVEAVYAASPCAEPMFYMTWGRKYGDEHNGRIFPPIGSYEGMDSLLALRYRMMADQNDASLCPVGRVWHYLRDNHPEIELYQPDNSHPSVSGTYAAACSFYTMLFLRNPEEITFDATLDPEMAATIRAAVRAVVFDSLSGWQRPQPNIEIVFADTASYMSVSFSLATTHADSVSIHWGDGSDTLFAAPATQDLHHLYAHEGEYTISVTASRHCMSAEYSFTYTATQEPSIPEGIATASIASPVLFPNPASHQVKVDYTQTINTIELLDLQGRVIKCLHPQANHFTLNLSNLPSGSYLIRIHSPAGMATSRLIKVKGKN